MKFHKIVLTLMMLCILSLSATALEDRGHIGSDWGYGSSPFLNVDYDDTIEQHTLTSVGHDNRYSTICDLDGDVDKELITFAGQFVQVYSLDEAGMTERANENIGEDVLEVACVKRIENSEGRKSILVFTETKAVMYDFGGTFLTASDVQYTYASTQTELSQPHCTQFTSTTPSGTDYVCSVGTGTEIFIVSSGYNIASYNITSSHDIDSKVIYDNLNKVVYSKDGNAVYQNNVLNTSNTSSMVRQTIEGVVSQTELVSYRDDFTGELVCITEDDLTPSGTLASQSYGIRCYRNGANVLDHNDDYGLQRNYHVEISKPIFYDTDRNGLVEMCYVSQAYETGDINLISKFVCITEGGTAIVNQTSTTNTFNSDVPNLQTIGNLFEVDNAVVLVNGDIRNITWFHNTSMSTDITATANAYAIDLDADDLQEIVEETFNFVNVYAKPRTYVDGITINPDADYQGLYGFIDPTCTLTTFPIKAKECINSLEGCTYDNDNLDVYVQEKLCTDCNGATAYHCGDLSYTNPEVYCQFNTTGTKQIDVDLFTTTNLNDVAYTFDFQMVVASESCDDPEDLIEVSPTPINESETPDNGTPTDDEAETPLEKILDNIWIILGLMFTVAIVGTMAYKGVDHPLILAVIMVACTLFFWLIAWYPTSFVMLLIVCIILLAIIVGVSGRRKD